MAQGFLLARPQTADRVERGFDAGEAGKAVPG
jgi:hypothetical protein